MEITMLKAKGVMVGIKNGMTLDDFCTKYQCSSDEFGERLRQIYGHNKRQIKNCFSQIEANQKKPRKETEPRDATDVVQTVDDAPVALPRSVELEELTRLEEEQSQRVMTLESEHKELAARHRELKNSLRGLSESIDKLMAEFQRHHQEFEKILSQNTTVEARMNEITAEWSIEKATLSDTRSRIEELSVVTLCVYDSGEISLMDNSVVELDDSGWKTRRDALLTMEECQELRLRDIDTLAKLLKIAEHLDYKVEVACDRSELENAFHKLRDRMPA
jgi:predicted RNase H-like nuclease (RuvC/YqgF family)